MEEVALELSQEGRMRKHQPKQVARGQMEGMAPVNYLQTWSQGKRNDG